MMGVPYHWTILTFLAQTWALYDYYDGTGYVSDLSDWGMMGGRAHQPKCVDIPTTMTLCKNIGYKTMRLPNLLGHESVSEAVDQARVWVPLLNLHCHPDTKLFLCSLYSPVCLEPSVYPCRSLCEGVKRGCEQRMKRYGYEWPEILRCDTFPNELCIEQVNFENANVCHPCKQPMTFESLLDSYCWANFVIKVKIKKTTVDSLGDTKLVTKGKLKFYKPKPNNMTKEEIKAMQLSITDGAQCDCDAVSNPGKRTLVMGAKRGNRYVLTYVSNWSKSKEFKRALRAIRKGHDCKKQIEKEIGGQNGEGNGLEISNKPDKPNKVDVNIGGGKFEVPQTGDNDKNNDKNKNKNKRDKGKRKDKGNKTRRKNRKNKNKGKKEDEDPMANIAGIGCIPCKQPLVFGNLIQKYCAANFVLKIKVKKIKIDDKNGDKRLLTKKLNSKDFYKQEGLSKRDLRRLQPVISGGSGCDCHYAKPDNTLFIMGHKSGGRDVVTYLSEFVKDSEFRRFTREIRNGYDCSKVVQTD